MGKRVLISESHGETIRSGKSFTGSIFNPLGYISHPFRSFERILKSFHYSIDYSKDHPLNHHILRSYDIIIINNPLVKFQHFETSSIEKFISRGGALLLIGRSTIPVLSKISDHIPIPLLNSLKNVHPILNGISQKFGISFVPDWIHLQFDNWNEQISYYSDLPENQRNQLRVGNHLKISKFAYHPILRKIKFLYYQGCSLKLTQDALALAYTDNNTVPPNAIIMATANHGDGRIFATGSQLIFVDTRLKELSIQNPQHAQLVLNIFTWLHGTLTEKAPPVTKIPDDKICPFCHTKNKPSQPFCNNCGSSI